MFIDLRWPYSGGLGSSMRQIRDLVGKVGYGNSRVEAEYEINNLALLYNRCDASNDTKSIEDRSGLPSVRSAVITT